MQIQVHALATERTHSHRVIIPLLISIPLAVQSSPRWSFGEWGQAEPVCSAYYHCLAANLEGQIQLHFLPDASAGLDWSHLAPQRPKEWRGETAILCRSGTRLGSGCYQEWIQFEWWTDGCIGECKNYEHPHHSLKAGAWKLRDAAGAVTGRRQRLKISEQS